MDACPLLITSIVAVKPEDQDTFFQDFLGLSGYLCSVPEMLRTTMKPNGWRYRRLGRINSRNGKLPKFRNKLQKRAESQPSGARCVSLLANIEDSTSDTHSSAYRLVDQ